MRPIIWNKTSVIPVNNGWDEEYTQLVFGSTTTLPKEQSIIVDSQGEPIVIVPKNNPIGFIW